MSQRDFRPQLIHAVMTNLSCNELSMRPCFAIISGVIKLYILNGVSIEQNTMDNSAGLAIH